MEINQIQVKKIFNSRGEETTESLICSKKNFGIGSAPSGASVSSKEAKLIKIDEGIKNFGKLKKKICGEFSQESFDEFLMDNIEKIGSNLTTSLSFAFFNANRGNFMKKFSGEFPYPLGNVLGGGAHHGKTDIQEILLLPTKAKTISEAIKTNFQIMEEIRVKYKSKFYGLNDEGALIMDFKNEEALEKVALISKKYKARIGIDLAASEIFDGKKYVYKNRKVSCEEQIEVLAKWIKDYNLYYIEDPFHENDFEGFRELTKRFGNKRLICGDDLFATQSVRLDKSLANSCIVKPNQVGTVTGALKCIQKAKNLGMVPVVSHRSGETCDSTISNLALLTKIAKFGISQIRVAKLNELIRLWDAFYSLGKKPRMALL